VRFKMTPTTSRLLEDLHLLSLDIEPRLELVSAAARAEWREMRSRFPTAQDVANGFSPLSDEQLTVMRSKVVRFRELLGLRRHLVRVGTPGMSVSTSTSAPSVLGPVARS
jgi:hypothetical protein